MGLLKRTTKISALFVCLILLTGARYDKFEALHQACDEEYGIDALQTFEMEPSHPFAKCHAEVNEVYPRELSRWIKLRMKKLTGEDCDVIEMWYDIELHPNYCYDNT